MAEASKPTILAFHGSGSNTTIHTVQLARLNRLLKPHFNIEVLEAPFPSAAGPGILPFFEGCGPFKRWIPPAEKLSISGMKAGEASPHMPAAVEELIASTVPSITRAQGGKGKVVGLIGFSQGTRVVAGLLKGAEICRALEAAGEDVSQIGWLGFEFAVSVCGSYPPALIPPAVSAALASSSLSGEQQKELVESRVSIPTLHIQGREDEWAWAGKLLIEGVYEEGEGKSEVRELAMGHHYPVLQEDSEGIREWVLDTYRRTAEREKR